MKEALRVAFLIIALVLNHGAGNALQLSRRLLQNQGERKEVSLPSSKSSLIARTIKLRSGSGMGGSFEIETTSDSEDSNTIEISGSRDFLDGIYTRADDINGRPHFEKHIVGDTRGSTIHLYWSGSQWVLHFDRDPSKSFDNMLAYSKVRDIDPLETSCYWNIRKGKVYVPLPQFAVTKPGGRPTAASKGLPKTSSSMNIKTEEMFGVPKQLIPLYAAFMLDAIAVGLAMPLLPFYVMELGANALQLSMVISSNYIAQTIGCIVMGRVSDTYGRRPVLFMCLAASAVSYFSVSKARTLVGVMLARLISGSFGGLVPVVQSCVADVSSQKERPKYLGRIMATFGLGFVLGPAVSAVVSGLSTRQKIRLSGSLPLAGLLIAVLFFKETKKLPTDSSPSSSATRSAEENSQTTSTNDGDKGASTAVTTATGTSNNIKKKPASPPVKTSVLLLVLNGFLLMYAFATESIYAMFMKDSFGYGERTLSTLFAVNGLFIGIFQVFLIKPMINLIGKHATLAVGNILLALGMVGIALVRQQTPHFMLFAGHIVGYSIADTALASLISRYSASATQGRDLALNQAAQSCARVLSPLFAGLLYERSKQSGTLPVGALPFLAGAAAPALGIAIPALLYIRSVANKRAVQTARKKGHATTSTTTTAGANNAAAPR